MSEKNIIYYFIRYIMYNYYKITRIMTIICAISYYSLVLHRNTPNIDIIVYKVRLKLSLLSRLKLDTERLKHVLVSKFK